MGHAFKLLLIIGDHIEILHYTNLASADDAFEAIGELPKSKDHKITVAKLYHPGRNTRRNWGE